MEPDVEKPKVAVPPLGTVLVLNHAEHVMGIQTGLSSTEPLQLLSTPSQHTSAAPGCTLLFPSSQSLDVAE
ncbi:hypothetical protein Q664_04255 [Archangium violaceum Cb vi76]|uniref:Uncharacterized protein n=1 Tax=Archangium violaceum Cb vi76 TaxID=1406225 RepID=A0A084T0B3_9BACT|nr:hypothetical protein Q664_04255 [Archangium violaceum Cb vi76]